MPDVAATAGIGDRIMQRGLAGLMKDIAAFGHPASTGPGHAFPITRRDFYCGDSASLSYVDPDEEEDG